jgi:hypothetical protein
VKDPDFILAHADSTRILVYPGADGTAVAVCPLLLDGIENLGLGQTAICQPALQPILKWRGGMLAECVVATAELTNIAAALESISELADARSGMHPFRDDMGAGQASEAGEPVDRIGGVGDYRRWVGGEILWHALFLEDFLEFGLGMRGAHLSGMPQIGVDGVGLGGHGEVQSTSWRDRITSWAT